jgi:hypothetical protein
VTNLTSVLLLFQVESSDPAAGSGAAGAVGGAIMLVWLAFVVLMIAAMWKVFVKAGEPGWAAIVPIYNYVVLDRIAGRPTWWILLWLLIAPIPYIVVSFDIAKRFGKGAGFGIGLILLPFIFYPMLAWGDNRYQAAVPATA